MFDLGGGVDRGVKKISGEICAMGVYIHSVSTGSSSRRRLILICSGGRAILRLLVGYLILLGGSKRKWEVGDARPREKLSQGT